MGSPTSRAARTMSSCRARSSPSACSTPVARHANVSMFAAPTMVSRLINHADAGSADTRGPEDHHLRRRADVRGRPQARARPVRPQALPALRPGREPDDHHRPRQGRCTPTPAIPRYEERLGSAGVARTGVAVRIVDEAGRELPPGEVGEIVTASDCVMQGYWNNPERQRAGAARRLAVDGRSGLPRCRRLPHPQGSLQGHDHLGRRQHLSARDRGGAADASRRAGGGGGRPAACRLGRGGDRLRGQARGRRRRSARQLDRLCLDNIARFKRPKGYRFVEALPKNNYGKILKTELRQLLESEG